MSRKIKFQPMQLFLASALTSDYQAMTVNGLPASLQTLARLFYINNSSTATVLFSTDGGITDCFVVSPNSYFVCDISSNKLSSPPDDGPVLEKGAVIMVKAISAGTGNIYFSYFSEVGE